MRNSFFFFLIFVGFQMEPSKKKEFCTEIMYLEKKNIRYKPSFKIMPKLVRLGHNDDL